MAGMLALIYANSVVAAAAFCLARSLSPAKTGLVDFLLRWFLLYFAQIVAVTLALGISGFLKPGYIIGAHTCILLFLLLLRPKLSGPAVRITEPSFIYQNRLLRFTLAVAVSFFAVKFAVTLINPPLGCDALIYHLTYPVTWLQNARLDNPMIVFGSDLTCATTNAAPYYPLNGEFLFFWLLFPLRSSFFANMAEAPFYLIGVLALYAVLRSCRIDRAPALFIGLLWWLIPNVFKHISHGAYVDIICASLFFLALKAALDLQDEWNGKNCFFLAVSLGLFLGTKAINLLWAATLVPLCIRAVSIHRHKLSLPRVMFSITGMSLLILALGGYSYIRAFVLTGNLFYPVQFTFLGKVLMPGYADRLSMANATYPWSEFSFKELLFGEGLGAQMLFFVLPATFLPQLWLVLRRRDSRDFWRDLCVFILPTLMCVIYFGYLKVYWTRYLYAYLGAGLVVAGIFLDRVAWGRRYLFVVGFLAVIASACEIARHGELIVSLALALALFLCMPGLFGIGRRVWAVRSSIRFIIVAAVCLAVWLGLSRAHVKYEKELYTRYVAGHEDTSLALAWQWLENNTSEGRRIAYTGGTQSYPLFGAHFKNNVYYVSVNDKPPVPHAYPDGQYRKTQNYSVWKGNLLRKSTDYLFIYRADCPDCFPVEDSWARQHPEAFEPVFSNPKARIYRIRK